MREPLRVFHSCLHLVKNQETEIVHLPTLRKNKSHAIPPLIPQHEKSLKHQFCRDLNELDRKVSKINHLSQEIEAEFRQLKDIATRLDQARYYLKEKLPPDQLERGVCEYLSVQIPVIYSKKPQGHLILTSCSVDLFKTERETQQVAQNLRKQNKKKRRYSQPFKR